jgi:transposase
MTRPYSMDLRNRAIARVHAGESVRSVAEALDISPSSVVKWSLRQRETGSAAPAKIGGYKPRILSGENRAWLLERMATSDFTLRGLVAELAERGVKVDYRSVWTFAHAEGLSFKKKPAARRAKPA